MHLRHVKKAAEHLLPKQRVEGSGRHPPVWASPISRSNSNSVTLCVRGDLGWGGDTIRRWCYGKEPSVLDS